MTFFEGEAEDEKITIKAIFAQQTFTGRRRWLAPNLAKEEVRYQKEPSKYEVRHTIKVRVTGGK